MNVDSMVRHIRKKAELHTEYHFFRRVVPMLTTAPIIIGAFLIFQLHHSGMHVQKKMPSDSVIDHFRHILHSIAVATVKKSAQTIDNRTSNFELGESITSLSEFVEPKRSQINILSTGTDCRCSYIFVFVFECR